MDKHSQTRIHTSDRAFISNPQSPDRHVWTEGGNRSSQQKLTQKHGEYTNHVFIVTWHLYYGLILLALYHDAYIGLSCFYHAVLLIAYWDTLSFIILVMLYLIVTHVLQFCWHFKLCHDTCIDTVSHYDTCTELRLFCCIAALTSYSYCFVWYWIIILLYHCVVLWCLCSSVYYIVKFTPVL